MKVAVISNQSMQTGKSSLILMLASTFARTQHKRVILLSTGDMKDMLDQAYVDYRAENTKSVQVYRAALKTALVSRSSCLDYGMRVGEEEVFAFNLFATTMERNELEELFLATMNTVRVELTLVEVKGGLEDPFNKRVLSECDAILNVFNMSPASLDAVLNYRNNFDTKCVLRTGYVCQKYDANALSESRVAKAIEINKRNLLAIPYNPAVIVKSYNKELNTIGQLVAEGNNAVIDLRMKLLEIMQYLFDDGKYKYIKGVSEWYK